MRGRWLRIATLVGVLGGGCGSGDDAAAPSPTAVTDTIAVTETAPAPEAAGTPAPTSPSPGEEPTPTVGGAWDPGDAAVALEDLECSGAVPEDETRGVTGTSIKVGGLGSMTGASTSVWGDASIGAAARFERANAEGGVHGRTIDYIGMEDDGLDSARNLDAARKLATNEEVFVIAPLMTALTSYVDVLCDEAVPFFGWGFNTGYCNNAIGFSMNGCLVTGAGAPYRTGGGEPYLSILADSDDKSVALVGNQEEAAQIGIQNIARSMTDAGLEPVYAESLLPMGAPITDPSPIVNDIMVANDGEPPALVFLVSDFGNTSAMTQGLQAAGYEGRFMNAIGYDPRLATVPFFDGAFTQLLWMPFEATDDPFVAQMNADFAAYAPDTLRSLVSASGYIAADFLVRALEATGPDLTVSGLLHTLNETGYVNDVGAFMGQTYWPLNHIVGTPCAGAVRLRDQAFTVAVPVSCGSLLPNE